VKAGRQVGADEAIVVQGEPPRFVSRGGEKLAAALDRFGVDPRGLRVLDAGASTGGFTDCVLQRGAAEVVAVDVGYGQLHERLRADPRVTVRDRTNVRHVEPGAFGGLVDLVVADLSFISLGLVLGALVGQCRPDGGALVLLVKPQFEAGREAASRGRGIITDPGIWHDVLGGVVEGGRAHGAEVLGLMPSPITGSGGNVEFLLHARPGLRGPNAELGSGPPADTAGLIERAVAEAVAGREA
jgi:23S rRNA (cytidine1920-2'-O)/16S rRNA (cytidine1409-2'-O)-methyltransferase